MNNSIDVFATSLSLSEEEVRGKTVVVIDVLRASSTILTGLANGAKGVIPAEDMGAAGKVAQNLDPSRYLLCGERDGKQIEGYDLGNSPSEYSKDVVEGKTLILTTTNGTKAIARCSQASKILIAGFLNLSAVATMLKNETAEIIIVCSGWKGRLSLEDVLCAGNLISKIFDGNLPDDAKDGAKVAMGLYERFGNEITKTVSSTNHAKRLAELGYASDIADCCLSDKYDFVPVLSEGVIHK